MARHTAKWDRCVRAVKKHGAANAYAVCTARIKNPAHRFGFVIFAKRGNGPRLFYARHRFTNNGEPKLFRSSSEALQTARRLQARFEVLRDYDFTIVGQSTRLKNPSRRADVDAAAERFEAFTGHSADSVERVKIRVPKAVLAVGPINAIEYDAIRDGKYLEYRHQFRKNSRPLLAASPDGRSLQIVGGRFEFTEAGIEDRAG